MTLNFGVMADKYCDEGSTISVFFVFGSGATTSTQNLTTGQFRLRFGSNTENSEDSGDEDNDSSAGDTDSEQDGDHDDAGSEDDNFAPSQTVSRSDDNDKEENVQDPGLVPYVDSDSEDDCVIESVELKTEIETKDTAPLTS